RNTECALGMFSFQLENKKNEGWALSVLLPSTNAHLVLLCYSPEENSESCQAFIISTLNSLAIDRGSYYESGVITSFAFPKNDEKKIELSIEDKKIESAINEIDSAAQDFLINLEYNVLTLYANHPKWKEAWQRYYRMIYRDTYGRLKRTAFDIYNALYFDAEDKNINNASYEYANTLLKWTQKFNYGRKKNNADFTSPIDAILGQGSDCDTRSLLLCVLLENSGIKSCLFVSREYGHAIFGLDVKNESEKENARIKVSEKNFLLGETTASVNLGLIAKDMSDTKKWIPVELY
ncbi:MAG: hypothetical protein IKI31_05845, partial [Treponema sp.]|nr:hypothetical protein [Treponema sp.]